MTNPQAEYSLRQGRPADAQALAELHVAVWRDTYRSMATAEAYEQLGVARRLPYWNEALVTSDPETQVILGEVSGQILGVISTGHPRDAVMADSIEIKHLYVANAARGTGLGKALLNAALDHHRAAGHRAASLAVVEGNDHARRFYRHLGGKEVGKFVDPGPLWRSSNIVVRWEL